MAFKCVFSRKKNFCFLPRNSRKLLRRRKKSLLLFDLMILSSFFLFRNDFVFEQNKRIITLIVKGIRFLANEII